MRRWCSVLLHIIAGFFFYMVMCLSFISTPSLQTAKWWMLLGFTLPALLALAVGMALNRFRNWKRDAGIVLLSASGFMLFLVFSLACMLMSEEFSRFMSPDSFAFFSDYLSGGSVIGVCALCGMFLYKTNMDASQNVELATGAPDAH